MIVRTKYLIVLKIKFCYAIMLLLKKMPRQMPGSFDIKLKGG